MRFVSRQGGQVLSVGVCDTAGTGVWRHAASRLPRSRAARQAVLRGISAAVLAKRVWKSGDLWRFRVKRIWTAVSGLIVTRKLSLGKEVLLSVLQSLMKTRLHPTDHQPRVCCEPWGMQ